MLCGGDGATRSREGRDETPWNFLFSCSEIFGAFVTFRRVGTDSDTNRLSTSGDREAFNVILLLLLYETVNVQKLATFEKFFNLFP